MKAKLRLLLSPIFADVFSAGICFACAGVMVMHRAWLWGFIDLCLVALLIRAAIAGITVRSVD